MRQWCIYGCGVNICRLAMLLVDLRTLFCSSMTFSFRCVDPCFMVRVKVWADGGVVWLFIASAHTIVVLLAEGLEEGRRW